MSEHVFEDRGIYYRIHGDDKSPRTIVLIHGLSGSSSAWIEFEKFFEHEYRVVSFDLRGHGYSRRPMHSAEYAMSAMAEDCVALLKHLQIEHPIIIGHSLGSLILFELLRSHPRLPSAVIFLSPEYDVNRRLLARIARILLKPVHVLRHVPFKHPRGRHVLYAPRYTGTGDWNVRRMIADIRATGVRSFLFATAQAFLVNATGVATTVTCPVLLVHGRRDTIFPVRNTEELMHEFPFAQSHILDNADHILVLNHAQEILPVLNQFIHDHVR